MTLEQGAQLAAAADFPVHLSITDQTDAFPERDDFMNYGSVMATVRLVEPAAARSSFPWEKKLSTHTQPVFQRLRAEGVRAGSRENIGLPVGNAPATA